MNDIETSVFATIAKTASVDVSTIRPTSTIRELGIPSLDVIEMLFELEEHFNIELSEREIDFATASAEDLVAAIQRGLAAKAAKAPKLATVNPA